MKIALPQIADGMTPLLVETPLGKFTVSLTSQANGLSKVIAVSQSAEPSRLELSREIADRDLSNQLRNGFPVSLARHADSVLTVTDALIASGQATEIEGRRRFKITTDAGTKVVALDSVFEVTVAELPDPSPHYQVVAIDTSHPNSAAQVIALSVPYTTESEAKNAFKQGFPEWSGDMRADLILATLISSGLAELLPVFFAR